MRKLGLTTIASIAVNVILSLWLVNQYYYDAYFHSYVDVTLGPVYPFIVLTAGLGGGSSLGYLLLKRRHAGDGTGRLEKAKLFKSGGHVQTPGSLSSSPQSKIMPTGPPPGQVSRHTAYAVPPLPKSPTTSSGGARGTTPPSLSIGSRTVTPSPSTSQRLDQLTQPSTSILNSTLRDQFRPEQAPRPPPPAPQPSAPGRGESVQPMNRIPPEPSRMSFPSQWKPEPGQSGERGPDSTVFPRPSQIDVKPGAEPAGFGGPVGQVPVQFRVRLDSDHLSRQGRVVRARLAIPTHRGQDNQAPLELLHRFGPISHVLLDRPLKEGLRRLSVAHCLNRGARRSQLREERQGARVKIRTFQSLHHSARIKVEHQRDNDRLTTRTSRRLPLAGRWIGTPHSIQY